MDMRLVRRGFLATVSALLLAGPLDAAAQTATAGQIVISEFRVRGPNGANDEYIVLHNKSGADHTVTAASGTGYGVAASDGTTRCSIPNGTIIPNRGAYLCVNSVGYSLASYPAGNGTTATGDATYTTDIPDNAGIAIFNNNTGGGSYSLANRLDAVGSTSEANTTYKEGSGYPALTPFSIDHAWTRDLCGKGGAVNLLGPCPTLGTVKDTDSNSVDFYFVDTNGTSAGGGQRLGAPAPRNLSSPPLPGSGFTVAPLDSCVAEFSAPNRVRDFTSDPANNSTFGTVDHRLTFTNNTGGNVTRLRFLIVDIDTFPAASGFADLRPRTSTSVVVTVDRPLCGSGTSNVTVQGTTLEQPPSQPNGGGFNSTMGAGTVTLGTPLANGASIDLRFLFGIQQTGNYRFSILLEALPGGGTSYYFECSTDGSCVAPTVSSIVRVNATPTNAASVQYTVTFSQSVTGVDVSDFALTTTGSIAGASVTGVSGSGTTYTVTVNTGTGSGTIRLDVVDDDTITSGIPLGGAGAGNGNFTTGEVYTIDKTAPTVTINQAGAQVDPTLVSPINFTVVFSETVTGFTNADVSFTGSTAGGTLAAAVTGGPTTYNVAVSGMTTAGTVVASIPAAAAIDAVTNASLASTSTDNSVTFSAPVAVTSYTAPSATGSGTITASFTGGGAGCSYTLSQFIASPPGVAPVPPTVPPGGILFPHGLFNFTVSGCTPGSTLTFTITYPQVLPAGTQYWKYGPTASDTTPHWYVLPATLAGNTATFTIADGGLGDDDLAANGTIVDQGGPGAPGATGAAIPTLSEWAMLLLGSLILLAAMGSGRRRRA